MPRPRARLQIVHLVGSGIRTKRPFVYWPDGVTARLTFALVCGWESVAVLQLRVRLTPDRQDHALADVGAHPVCVCG